MPTSACAIFRVNIYNMVCRVQGITGPHIIAVITACTIYSSSVYLVNRQAVISSYFYLFKMLYIFAMKISDDIKYQNWQTGREVAQCSSHLCFCNYFSGTHYFHPVYLIFPNILFYRVLFVILHSAIIIYSSGMWDCLCVIYHIRGSGTRKTYNLHLLMLLV